MLSEMAVPAWDPALSVGHAKLDEQHITLLELGRQVLGFLEAPPYQDETVHALLQDIVGLAREHDALEEHILAAHGCPSLEAHRLGHASTLAGLTQLLDSAARHQLNTDLLVRVITDWRLHHISDEDLRVKDYLKAEG